MSYVQLHAATASADQAKWPFFINNTSSWLLIPENNFLEEASALLLEFFLAFLRLQI
jgi:hypothetical protein